MNNKEKQKTRAERRFEKWLNETKLLGLPNGSYLPLTRRQLHSQMEPVDILKPSSKAKSLDHDSEFNSNPKPKKDGQLTRNSKGSERSEPKSKKTGGTKDKSHD